MNLGQLQSEIGRLLSDPNNERWIGNVLTTRINEAQTEIQGMTKAVKTSTSYAVTAGTSGISLSAGTMNIARVWYTNAEGNSYAIQGITLEELTYRYPNWENWENGTPVYYKYDATYQTIRFVPRPSEDITVNVLEILKPADLVDSGDIPFDANNQMIPYHMSIAHWVVAQCWMDDGTPEAMAKSRYHKTGDIDHPGQFELQIKRINEEFDSPIDIPTHVMWKPQGGRLGMYGMPTKSYPFRY